MSDVQPTPPQPGPEMADTLLIVRGAFPSDAALQDAVGRLTLAGFDRAEISLPVPAGTPGAAAPEQGAENPDTADDDQQMRTMHTGMAGTAGAMLAAGVVVATGGAAIPAVAAAVAAGLAAGGVAHTVSRGANETRHEEREAAAGRGELFLEVRATTALKRSAAEAALREAGATRIERIVQT